MTLISNDVGEIRFRHEAARPPPAIDGEGNQASDHDRHGRIGRQAPILASLHEEPGSQAVEGQGDGDTDGETDGEGVTDGDADEEADGDGVRAALRTCELTRPPA